jgi:putative transcriptional regulator
VKKTALFLILRPVSKRLFELIAFVIKMLPSSDPGRYHQPGITMPINMKLRLARVEKMMSQQDLADRVGATRQTIGLIEKGDYNPTLKLCVRIARALDRTLDQLFWEEEKR